MGGMRSETSFYDLGVNGLAKGEAVEVGAGFEGEGQGVGALWDVPLAHFSIEGEGL